MGFGKDLRSGLQVMLHPGEATKKSLEVGAAYNWYFKVTLIPLIVLIVVALIMVTAFAASPIAGLIESVFAGFGYVVGLSYVAAIVLPILFMWILIPVSIFVSAALYHIVGTWIGVFKGDFNKTLAAVMFGALPTAIFLFAFIVPSSYPMYFIFAFWGLVVLVVSLTNQQKLKWTTALGVVIMTVAVVTAIVGVILTLFISAVSSVVVGIINALVPHIAGSNGYTTPLTFPTGPSPR